MANVRVGDTVAVPGDMHGIVKFVGPVDGKKGVFAGVQLANEFAARGKNSGEVEGKYYFKTTIPGAGIFLPVDKAIKKAGMPTGLGVRQSPGPGTPTRLTSFNQGGRTPGPTGFTKPNFSQSVGPAMRAGAASPALKPPMRRESLPRPSSPLRKTAKTPTPKVLATPKTRPSGIGLAKSTNGAVGGAVGGGLGQHRPGGVRPPNAFSQSLRQSTSTPSQSSLSPLGPESGFDEIPETEAEHTPTPTPNFHRTSDVDVERYETKIRGLTDELSDTRRQLRDQTTALSEMERQVNEIQSLVPGLGEDGPLRHPSADDDDLPRDVVSLRDALREKNEKIRLMTAEFDANRADFRSTIDTLEMASTETERVYEKRVDDLLEEVRTLQDRSEDVETVAQQLKQLEELVAELEEGLEDARRGEAEARGEVEFLRGEVERSHSELRRERERQKTEEQLNGYPSSVSELEAQLTTRDDEIRGLKAIIQNMNNSSDAERPAQPPPATSTEPSHARTKSSVDTEADLHAHIASLEELLHQKTQHEEELEHEVKQLRNSVTLNRFHMPPSAFGIRSGGAGQHSRHTSEDRRDKHKSNSSQRTVVLDRSSISTTRPLHNTGDNGPDASKSPTSPVKPTTFPQPQLNNDQRNDDEVSDVSSSAVLWCEICEEGGHDILTCTNMFSPNKPKEPNGVTSSPVRNGKDVVREGLRRSHEEDRPAPLVSRKSPPRAQAGSTAADELDSPTDLDSRDRKTPLANARGAGPMSAPPSAPPPDPVVSAVTAALGEGSADAEGMVAGKSSGVVDKNKWCALCERDGHDSVDCPVEEF